VFDRVTQMADNAGATDAHRALNYLSVRYPAVYAQAAEQFARNASLTSVQVQGSAVFARVDVTEEFPFLVSKLAPYWDYASSAQ
jgi:uncharacterized Zn finger protein